MQELTINFGKYKDRTIQSIWESDPEYLVWVYENTNCNKQIKNKIHELVYSLER